MDPRPLLEWFDRARRDLPWRRTRTAYRTWVSEIMLQQTRVETVVPYFERFIARFPDPRALAGAELDVVLEHWSGLGYYRRARQLHAAALAICERHGGEVPAQLSALEALPGVGRYTAGAIASIAFNQRVPSIDGNVTRVVARWLNLDEAVSKTAKAAIEAALDETLPTDRPGDFNEAMMDLGATICVPRAPRCDACPMASQCAGRAAGRAAEIPAAKERRAVPKLAFTAAIVERDGEVLLGQRPTDGLFGGLWEPPLVEGRGARARSSFAAAGIQFAPAARAQPAVVHVLTHRVMNIAPIAARVGEGRVGELAPYTRFAWGRAALGESVRLELVDASSGQPLPLSTLARKVLAASPSRRT